MPSNHNVMIMRHIRDSVFCYHRKWADVNPEATMRIEWKGGEWMKVAV